MLKLTHFEKRYQDRLILSVETLHIAPGINWITGENGSGKTSLFKSIAGIVPCDGEITLNSVSLLKDPVEFRRLVNFAEAEPVYPTFLTAKDLVRFVGKAKGASIAQQDILCQQLGVEDYFTKPCGTYSSGMIKKVSLVLAFLGDPILVLLDEPLVTLDEKARKSLAQIILEKLTNPSMTFLISSHQVLDGLEINISGKYKIHHQTIEQLADNQ